MVAMSGRRFSLVLVCLLASVPFGAACGSDPVETGGAASTTELSAPPGTEATTTTEAVRVIEVAFAGGAVVGGPRREPVKLGEKVRLVVTSDRAEEVHVHTYDLKADVTPAQPAEITFVASIPGVHEVELERSHKLLVNLEVR